MKLRRAKPQVIADTVRRPQQPTHSQPLDPQVRIAIQLERIADALERIATQAHR